VRDPPPEALLPELHAANPAAATVVTAIIAMHLRTSFLTFDIDSS
jgi:hypothetical protein